jgi:TolB protein
MNADGGKQRRLTNNPAGDGFPTWSPNGKKIVFMTRRDGNHEIYVMSRDGSTVRRLTKNPAKDQFPSWQPSP